MKVGDLVQWLDPWDLRRLGLIVVSLLGGYYNVLVDGKIEFCHKSNLELISESR